MSDLSINENIWTPAWTRSGFVSKTDNKTNLKRLFRSSGRFEEGMPSLLSGRHCCDNSQNSSEILQWASSEGVHAFQISQPVHHRPLTSNTLYLEKNIPWVFFIFQNIHLNIVFERCQTDCFRGNTVFSYKIHATSYIAKLIFFIFEVRFFLRIFQRSGLKY